MSGPADRAKWLANLSEREKNRIARMVTDLTRAVKEQVQACEPRPLDGLEPTGVRVAPADAHFVERRSA